MSESIHERMAMVDQMYRDGLEMKRQQLRRQHPEADDDGIEELLRMWLLSRPPDVSPFRIRPNP